MKRSSAVGLILAGTALVGAYAIGEKRDCAQQPDGTTPASCGSSSSGGHGFYSSSNSSTGGTTSSTSGATQAGRTGTAVGIASPGGSATAPTSRGGFGASGSFHASGS